MKKRIGTLNGKPIIQGDANLQGKNEIRFVETPAQQGGGESQDSNVIKITDENITNMDTDQSGILTEIKLNISDETIKQLQNHDKNILLSLTDSEPAEVLFTPLHAIGIEDGVYQLFWESTMTDGQQELKCLLCFCNGDFKILFPEIVISLLDQLSLSDEPELVNIINNILNYTNLSYLVKKAYGSDFYTFHMQGGVGFSNIGALCLSVHYAGSGVYSVDIFEIAKR